MNLYKGRKPSTKSIAYIERELYLLSGRYDVAEKLHKEKEKEKENEAKNKD